MLDRIANQIQSSANPSLDSLKKLAGLERKRGDGKAAEMDFTELDGSLQTQAAKRMLRWHAEAVSRVIELTAHGDLHDSAFAMTNAHRAKDAQTLLYVLFDHIGRAYVETVIDQ